PALLNGHTDQLPVKDGLASHGEHTAVCEILIEFEILAELHDQVLPQGVEGRLDGGMPNTDDPAVRLGYEIEQAHVVTVGPQLAKTFVEEARIDPPIAGKQDQHPA